MDGFLEGILRRRADFGESLKEPAAARGFIRSAILWLIALGAFYGFTMGAYNLIHAGTAWNAVTSMIKVPILLLATMALCFPALYVFGLAGGATLRASSLWAALTGALLVTAIALVSLSPIVFFFLTTIDNYKAVQYLHVIVWAFSGLLGLKFLRQTLLVLDPVLMANRRLLAFWTLLFGLVGMQGAWMMRPFIGNPALEFRAFRHLHGNIFKELGRPILKRMGDGEGDRRGERPPRPAERRDS